MPRIARVIARLNIGGPAIHVATLTSRLPPPFTSRLFAGDVSPGEAEMTSVLASEHVTPTKIPGLGRAIRPDDDLRALLRLIAELRAFRPHIVHTHTAKAGTLGRIAATICRVPILVHTFHGHVFDGYFSPAKTRAFVLIERTLARATDAIVTISPRQRDDLTQKYRVVRPETVRVIPLGFDLARFDRVASHRGELRKELGLGPHEPLIATVGRLTDIKDHPLLLRAFQELHDPTAHLCVVGGGECEPALRRLAQDLGIAPRTHFLGFRTDLERLLADVDVVALTSRNEGTPVALIEALAAGCAVVSVAVGGVADVLEDGRWGILVPERTPRAMASALRTALDRRSAPPRESVEAGRYVREKYGIQRLVSDHTALYTELLARKGVRISEGFLATEPHESQGPSRSEQE